MIYPEIAIIDYNKKPEYKYKLTAEQLDIIRPFKDLTYLDTIVAKLIEVYKLNLTAEQKDNLKTYVYLASDQFRQEVKDAKQAKMEADGWKLLTEEVAKELNGQKIMLNASQDIDWFTAKVENIYKIFVNPQNQAVYIMKPRAKTRGTALVSLNMPMYKTI